MPCWSYNSDHELRLKEIESGEQKEEESCLFIITLLISIVLSNIFLLYNYTISPAFFCIVIGLLVGNLVTFSKHTNQLISFILTNVLKVGIALLGIGLSIHELFKYGLGSVLLIIINILFNI